MNFSSRPTLVTTPPPFKTVLETVVNAFEKDAYPLALTSKLGKRRLFRHRVWPEKDCACPGWQRLFITPGWLTRTEGGNQKVVVMEICRDSEVEATIEALQERYGVHLWRAPLNFPHTPGRGNEFRRDASGYSGGHLLRASRRPWRGVLKAVKA